MRKLLILFILVIAFSGYGWVGEGCECEQWVCEERVDTIYSTQMDGWDGRCDLVTAVNTGTGTFVQYVKLNNNGEYWFYDLDEITCDSAWLDSINWQISIYSTDSDTVLLGYIDPMGGSCISINSVTTDTIITATNRDCMDTTVVFNKIINKSNKRYFPYIVSLNTSSAGVYLGRLILYYKACNKRYGIPGHL